MKIPAVWLKVPVTVIPLTVLVIVPAEIVRFGKVVAEEPPIVAVALKSTVPVPKIVAPLFVQLPAAVSV